METRNAYSYVCSVPGLTLCDSLTGPFEVAYARWLFANGSHRPEGALGNLPTRIKAGGEAFRWHPAQARSPGWLEDGGQSPAIGYTK